MSDESILVKERGDRLVQAMRARQIKKTYAIAIEVGVSESSFSRWRNGGTISTESAIKICEVLDISLDWFLAGRGNMNQHKERSITDYEYQLVKNLRNLPQEAIDSLNQFLNTLSYQQSSAQTSSISEPAKEDNELDDNCIETSISPPTNGQLSK